MSTSITSSMVALRAADPADQSAAAALAPDWLSVLARLDAYETAGTDETAGADATVRRAAAWGERSRRRIRRVRLAAAGVMVVAAATFAGVVAWPGSGHGPAAVAYGVTRQSDGTVTVRRSPTHPFTSTDLQAQLRAAGVPADVLAESPAGTCTEPLPDAVPTAGRVITFPSTISRGEGFLIHPAAIPAGAVLVVVLPPIATTGASSTVTPAFAGLYVTVTAPTCVGEPAPVGLTSPPPK
jgi:hypothetical protein